MACKRKLVAVQQIYLYPFTKGLPTNEVMLTYRTCMYDLHLPFAAASTPDEAAAALRDKLMPVRSAIFHKHCTCLLRANRALLQSSVFGCPGVVDFVGARTLWLDGLMGRAIQEGCTQVVVIAAGFCTRAHRMAARGALPPGISFYEVDLPEASRQKRELMSEVQQKINSCTVPSIAYIGADLSQVSLDKALLQPSPPSQASAPAGDQATAQSNGSPVPPPFDPKVRTLFTAEGLTYYLPPKSVEDLFLSISRLSAMGSLVGFDCLDADVHSGLREARGYHTIRLTVQNKGEKFLSGLPAKPDEMAATLGKAGLHLQTMYDASGLRNSLLGIAANANEGQKAKQLKLPSFFRYIEAYK